MARAQNGFGSPRTHFPPPRRLQQSRTFTVTEVVGALVAVLAVVLAGLWILLV